MTLGTWGRSSRSGPNSEELARAVDAASDLCVGGGGGGAIGARGVRVPGSISPEDIFRAVGSRCAFRRPVYLTGITSTGRRDFGACLRKESRVPLQFEYWFPHTGVAIDVAMPPGGDREIDAKLAWCQPRKILYFPPGTALEVIADTVRIRRERTAA